MKPVIKDGVRVKGLLETLEEFSLGIIPNTRSEPAAVSVYPGCLSLLDDDDGCRHCPGWISDADFKSTTWWI